MLIKGWASRKEMDTVGHVVAPEAFTASIRARGLKGPEGVKLLHQHERDRVLGTITKLEPRREGVWIEAIVDEKLSFGRDVAQMIRASGGLNFSVGFWVLDADIEETPGGREYLLITKGELSEVSVVTFPANELAHITEYAEDD